MITAEFVWQGEKYKVTYLSRADWGGGPVRAGHAIPASQIWGWFLHHTVMVMQDYDRDGYLHGDLDDVIRYMRMLQTARPDLGSEVPYSWVVFRGDNDRHAIICEGRGRGRTGAHTAGYNSTFYAWSLAGNFENERPSNGMVAAMRWLAARETPNALAATRGHRHVTATACPGKMAMPRLHELQPPFNDIKTPSTPTEEFVMATKQELEQMLESFFAREGFGDIALEQRMGMVRAWRLPDGTIANITFYEGRLAVQYQTDIEAVNALQTLGVLPNPIPQATADIEKKLSRLRVVRGT